MCVKRSAVFGARFRSLSLYFLYQKGNLIRIKTGLDTYLIHIQTLHPCHGTPLMIILSIINGGIAQKRFLAHFCTVLRKFALFCRSFWQEQTHRNAQKKAQQRTNCTETRHFAQTHPTPPFVIPPSACIQIYFCMSYIFLGGGEIPRGKVLLSFFWEGEGQQIPSELH